MISNALYDLRAYPVGNTQRVVRIARNEPVEVLEKDGLSHPRLQGANLLKVKNVDGLSLIVDAAGIEPYSRDETLSVVAQRIGYPYYILARAAKRGSLLARWSGNAWLTTERAARYAIERGHIRPPKSERSG